MAVYDGDTLVELFRTAVDRRGDELALVGPDTALTWNEYGARANALARRLLTWGLGRGDRVALMTGNSVDFHVVDMATLIAGGVPFSLHNDDAESKLAALLSVAKPSILFAEAQFEAKASRLAEAVGIARVERVDPGIGSGCQEGFTSPAAPESGTEDIATLIFTSGTTGEPKAVKLSHRCVVSSIRGTDALAPMSEGGRVLSYLPLGHIAERFMSYYSSLATGSTVHVVPGASDLYDEIRRVRPTRFFGVPRVYEKLADRGRVLGLGAAETVRALGLDRTEYLGVATAPSSELVLQYFADLKIPVSNIWGMSEAIMCTLNPPSSLVPGSVGVFLDSCEGRVAEDGELLVRGENVMSGYLGDPTRTREVIDADGWLHTGDLGRIDENGYLFILGRKKEILITATGKNVLPNVIEGALQDESPLVDRAVAIAEGRRFVTALLAPNAENVLAFAAAHGVEGTVAELTEHPVILAEVQRSVSAANSRLGRAETVRAWHLLPAEWQPGSPELTATMKVRRDVVMSRYEDRIELLYSRATSA